MNCRWKLALMHAVFLSGVILTASKRDITSLMTTNPENGKPTDQDFVRGKPDDVPSPGPSDDDMPTSVPDHGNKHGEERDHSVPPSYGPSFSPEPAPYGPYGPTRPPTDDDKPPKDSHPGSKPPSSGNSNQPSCASRDGICLKVNSSAGTALDAFQLSAVDWVSGSKANSSSLMYEFGVAAVVGNSILYKARQSYSPDWRAVVVGLPVGNVRLYVCVRTASESGEFVGPAACSTVAVQVSAEVSAGQVEEEISSLQKQTAATTASAAAALNMAQRLAAVVAVGKDTTDKATVKSLASGLLGKLVAASTSNDATSTASVLQVFDGVTTLWSMAGASGKAAVLGGVSSLSRKLADQQLAVEDAQPVVNLFTGMLDDAMDLVSAAVESATGGGSASNVTAARKEAARGLLESVTSGTTALMRGLLNGAPANGSAVYVSTARLSAAIRRASAALASAGVSISVDDPATASRRRQLLADTVSSAVSVALNPAVGSLCAADTGCSSSGVGLSVTVLGDVSLLIAALGGSTAPLAAGISDYLDGGSAEIISSIVRVTAPGLPASALGMSNLITFAIPVNSTAVALNGATARRALIRLQDIGAAAVDASAGIAAGASASGVTDTTASTVTGYSNSLGDFVVLQYSTAATVTSGSPPPSQASGTSSPDNAGLARLPSPLVISTLMALALFILKPFM